MCAIRLISDCCRMVFINVYLPVEDGNVNFDEFCLQLPLIENVIASHPDDLIVWGGDCNIDFTRLSVHTSFFWLNFVIELIYMPLINIQAMMLTIRISSVCNVLARWIIL